MTANFRTGVDWQDVRVFSALARLGTLSGTARALGVNHATIGRRVARLETALGVQLFNRRPDGYQLTAEAAPLLDAVQRMEDAAEGLIRQGGHAPLTGLVRMTATASLIDAFLLRWLAPFLADHPGLEVDIAADRRALSLARYETDIAIRMGRPVDGGVIARRLVDVAYGIFGAEAEVARVEAGEAPRFVAFDEVNAAVPEAAWLARTFPQANVRLRVGTHLSQAAACAAGVGLAVLPAYVAAGFPELRPVALGASPPPRTLWMLTRDDVRSTPRLRATASFVADVFVKHRALFEPPSAPP